VSGGLGHSIVFAPPPLDAEEDCGAANAITQRCVAHKHVPLRGAYGPVSRRVAHLGGLRCPNAVAGRIVSIHIAPFKRPSERPLSHVGEERLKFVPSFADGNSPSAVVRKDAVVRIGAPVSHVAPRQVFWRPRPRESVCFVLLPRGAGRLFRGAAAASRAMLVKKLTARDRFNRPAFTPYGEVIAHVC
jgi:hypothetical protein